MRGAGIRMARETATRAPSFATSASVAQAEALKIQNTALAQNRDVFELRRIEIERVKAERWNGALPTSIYAGALIPLLNPMATPAK